MITLRASALGSCIKAQVALLMGYTPLDPPDKIQAAYDRGNEHEDANAVTLVASGWEIISEQREVVLSITPEIQVVGHVDGLTREVGTPDFRVWESKAPNAWAKFEKAYKTGDWSDPLCHRYAWQISCYMIGTGLEAIVTCFDGDTIKSFVIEVPPYTLNQIQFRAGTIAGLANDAELPRRCTQNDYPCPVAYLHETEDPVEDETLDALVADYDHQSMMIKEWEAKKKRTTKKIEEYAAGQDITTVSSKVSFYEQSAADRIDRDAMKADGVYERYATPGTTSPRMKITKRGTSVTEE